MVFQYSLARVSASLVSLSRRACAADVGVIFCPPEAPSAPVESEKSKLGDNSDGFNLTRALDEEERGVLCQISGGLPWQLSGGGGDVARRSAPARKI